MLKILKSCYGKNLLQSPVVNCRISFKNGGDDRHQHRRKLYKENVIKKK